MSFSDQLNRSLKIPVLWVSKTFVWMHVWVELEDTNKTGPTSKTSNEHQIGSLSVGSCEGAERCRSAIRPKQPGFIWRRMSLLNSQCETLRLRTRLKTGSESKRLSCFVFLEVKRIPMASGLFFVCLVPLSAAYKTHRGKTNTPSVDANLMSVAWKTQSKRDPWWPDGIIQYFP